jgi:hypothetical protein
MNQRGKKNSDSKKKIDIKLIEEQVQEIISSDDIAELDSVEIPDEIRNRLQKVDFTELTVIEQEFGITQNIGHETDEENKTIHSKGISNDIPERKHEVTDHCIDRSSGEGVVDSSCNITVSGDRMNAQIDLHPSKGGGVPLTITKVKEELEAAGVVYGINYDLLKKLIATSEKTKEQKVGVIIAQGTPSQEGRDGMIEYLFSDDEEITGVSQEMNKSS